MTFHKDEVYPPDGDFAAGLHSHKQSGEGFGRGGPRVKRDRFALTPAREHELDVSDAESVAGLHGDRKIGWGHGISRGAGHQRPCVPVLARGRASAAGKTSGIGSNIASRSSAENLTALAASSDRMLSTSRAFFS